MYIYLFMLICLFTKADTDEHIGHLEEGVEHYRNIWMVLIPNGLGRAKTIAENEGFLFEREIAGFPNLFQFQHPTHPDKEKYENKQLTSRLKNNSEVSWAQQIAAVKRGISNGNAVINLSAYQLQLFLKIIRNRLQCPASEDLNAVSLDNDLYNDTLFPLQWYLHECAKSRSVDPIDHINVVNVWKKYKIFGKGIVVVVLDDGIDPNHPDLKNNYSKLYSYDFMDNNNINPTLMHATYGINSHGTQVAGVIAMTKNNELCGVGIAPEVTFGVIRLIGPFATYNIDEATAFLYMNDEVHIKHNSWNPVDNGIFAQAMSPATADALKAGVTIGRKNKGIIYVFSAGNGKIENDMCGCDAFVSSIYTIAVASVDAKGIITEYSERCASVMVTAYSNGLHSPSGVVTTDIGNRCTMSFGGTSASAAIVSGGIALALQIKPTLTWRDIKHLLAYTSQIIHFRRNKSYKGWIQNSAGFLYSPDFGFGMIDVNNLVTKAKTFVSVPPMSTCIKDIIKKGYYTRFGPNGFKVKLNTNACKGKPSEINYIEHVQILISVDYPKRGDLQITLQSPSGTRINVLETRINDYSYYGFNQWIFSSIHAWGENPVGSWEIFVFTPFSSSSNVGFVHELKLIINGTKTQPDHYAEARSYDK